MSFFPKDRVEFILKDRDRVGDMWTDRENRVKDFAAAMKGWFFNDDGTFNADVYNNFKVFFIGAGLLFVIFLYLLIVIGNVKFNFSINEPNNAKI